MNLRNRAILRRQAVFKSAARELAKIVKGVYRNGNFDIPVYVSYSGGVFKAMKYIKETLEEELRDVSCVFTEPCLLPSAGGIILACRAAGNEVSEQMIENLRTAQHMRV